MVITNISFQTLKVYSQSPESINLKENSVNPEP
jgi:hypothetical protein